MNDGVAVGTQRSKILHWVHAISFSNRRERNRMMDMDDPLWDSVDAREVHFTDGAGVSKMV
jgi:hypothetical protein